MVRPGGQRAVQRHPPVGLGLPRRAVDQVQADVLEPLLPRPRGALLRPAGLVHPVQHGQDVRRGALHAQRDAGEPGRPQRGQLARPDGLGVGLHGHLGAGSQAEPVADGGQDRAQVGGRQQRRRPAAEEHRPGRPGPPVRHLGGQRHLGHRQPGIVPPRGARPQLIGGVGVEIAVSAAGLAERHMHIYPERMAPQPVQRARRERPVGRRRLAVRRLAGHLSRPRSRVACCHGSAVTSLAGTARAGHPSAPRLLWRSGSGAGMSAGVIT